METDIKVSVIVPCYNCEQWIEQTLKSLKEQTFQKFEIICINDGSTDATLKKLKVWQEKSGLNLKIINQPNGGVSRARNAGIRNVVGEFVLFLDADDCLGDSFIECLYSALKENGTDTAYCFYSRVYTEVMGRKLSNKLNYVVQNQCEVMSNLLYRMAALGFYCYLYRRDILIRENIFFDVDTKHFEDREFNWKYLCHCRSAVMVDAPLYWYRVNSESVTQRVSGEWRMDAVNAVLRIEDYLKQYNCSFYDEVKAFLLSRVLWASAKRLALAHNKEFFKRLALEFDMKTRMRQVSHKDPNKVVRLAARLYLIHPMLFYYVVGLKNKRRGGKR